MDGNPILWKTLSIQREINAKLAGSAKACNVLLIMSTWVGNEPNNRSGPVTHAKMRELERKGECFTRCATKRLTNL